jgi:hypothetical protein
MRHSWILTLIGLGTLAFAVDQFAGARPVAENEVPLVFSGGHEIAKGDFGRPVPLIAAALEVQPDEFRKAFSGVTPAKGRGPSGDEARKNKSALMKVLKPLGVTNDRLDEVSNYYRFRPQNGELWKTSAAKGYAVVEDGKVKKVVITEAGSGYCSSPKVTIRGMDEVSLEITLHFDRELKKNGSVEKIEVAERPTGR